MKTIHFDGRAPSVMNVKVGNEGDNLAETLQFELPPWLDDAAVSRLGQLKHCNSKRLRARMIRQNFVRMLKNIIRKHHKKEAMEWNTALRRYMERRFSAGVPA